MTTARTKRRSPLPPAVRRYLAAAPVCRLATASADGEPHVIPVCPVFDGVDTLYVDIGPKYRTAKHVAANPRATVLIDDYSDDWSELRRVILQCRVRIARGAERDAAWRRIRRKFPQYRAIDWQPRLTLSLRIEAFRHEGIVG
jgi:nitroimidazol reductase NimA-like FMN-containing flavoprotein (pyridoxamine 5'-phosphate oxidase superfamily)